MERYVRLVEPVLRGPVVIVIAIAAFVAAGAIGGRVGVALASAFVAFHASYCMLNFWLCRETHCVVTGTGWALLAVLGFAAALVPGASLSWYRANVVTIGYLVVLGLGYVFEWAVAARTGRRALARSGPDITPQPEPVRMVTESNAGGIDDRPPLLRGRSVALRPLKPAPGGRPGRAPRVPARSGSTILVNGTVGPYLEVTTELVRLRLLNRSTARTYDFGFDDGRNFQLVATDGGYLAALHSAAWSVAAKRWSTATTACSAAC